MVEDVIGPKEELRLFGYIDVALNHLLCIYTYIQSQMLLSTIIREPSLYRVAKNLLFTEWPRMLNVRIRNCCRLSPSRTFISPLLGSGSIVEDGEERM